MLLLAVLLGTALWSCTDDIDYPRPNDEEFDGITLTIPNPALLQTRAATEAGITPAESKITELYLFLFDQSGNAIGNSPINIKEKLTASEGSYSLPEHEGTTKINLDYGDFLTGDASSVNVRPYVVANISDFLASGQSNLSAIKNESDLKALKLDFKGDNSKYKLNKTSAGETGLPMIATLTDISFTSKNAQGNIFTNTITSSNEATGYYTVEKGKPASFHADLAFLVAKVRLNIFFDNTEGTTKGFSRDIFGNLTVNFEDGEVFNVCNDTKLVGFSDVSERLNLGKQAFIRKQYPNDEGKDVKDYPYTEEQRKTDLTDWKTGDADNGQRAWQTSFYVPSTQGAGITSVTLHAATIEGATEKGKLEYNISLVPAKRTDSSVSTGNSATTPINRATAYDITARVLGPQTLKTEKVEVQRWTPKELIYTLGVPVYLHVDKTTIPVTAGMETALWFDTNVNLNEKDADNEKMFRLIFPQYDHENEKIDLYKYRVEGDSIYISINPDIDPDWFDEIRSNMGNYDFFHIKARNLYKKISVSPLKLKRFLTVSPTTFAVDVRELMASGKMDKEDFTFEVSTNLKSFFITKDDWSADSQNAIQIYLKSGNNRTGETLIKMDGTRNTINMVDDWKGIAEFVVRASGINAGKKVYTDAGRKTLSFTVSADNEGQTGVNYINDVDMNVTVIPASEKYIIHFRGGSKNNWWGNMHIYAYQCLIIPKDFIYKSNGVDLISPAIAGRTVSDGGNDNAALQYLFSGKIAFRGWDVEVNKASLNKQRDEENKPNTQGFIVLPDGNWAPDNDVRYDRNFDFFKDYRNNEYMPDCDKCRNDETRENNEWKLIAMKPEGNGWWRIELPAVAEPGKTFLMFNSGHTDVGIRFPGNNEVGVPLFDYPSREGWLDHSTDEGKMNSFTSENLQKQGSIISNKKHKIYFETNTGWSSVRCYYWNGATVSWPGVSMTKESDGKWSVEIPEKAKNLLFNNGANEDDKSPDMTHTLTQDTYVYNKNNSGDDLVTLKLIWQYQRDIHDNNGNVYRNQVCFHSAPDMFDVNGNKLSTGTWHTGSGTGYVNEQCFSFKINKNDLDWGMQVEFRYYDSNNTNGCNYTGSKYLNTNKFKESNSYTYTFYF